MSDKKQIADSYFVLKDLVQREVIGCRRDLTQFAQVTAATYEGIALNLPIIISQIEETNENARTLIEYFIASDACNQNATEITSAMEAESVVSNTVREAKHNMVAVSRRIHEMFKIDQAIFKHIQKQVNQIESLRKSILEITKISDDIELLSYNSVFVASKAGLSGAAFSYIAKEIKVLSNQTKNYARRMRESSDELVKNYETFSGEIEALNEKTSQRLSNIDSELDTIFSKYNSGLTNIANLIFQTLERADTTKEHVPAIMVSLQPQDLVRQLLDQVDVINNSLSSINSLRLNKNYTVDGDSNFITSIEDKTANIIAASNLNKAILEKINTTLDISVIELSTLLKKLHYELKDIETDRISMIDFFSSPQDFLQGKSSIEQIFDESVTVIKEIFNFIETSILKKREVACFGKKLKQDLQNIEALFNGMRHIVRQFATIKVVSRIEISRENMLSENMTASTEMFDKLTENIDQHILLLRKNLETINADIIANLESLNQNITSQEDSLSEINDMVNKSINKLQTIRFNINDAVKTVGEESGELFDLIDRSLKGADKIRNIVAASRKISAHYDTVLSHSSNLYQLGKQYAPGIFNNETSYYRFPDLIEIANKFSIFPDKKETNITHVDESSELAGDLVLF